MPRVLLVVNPHASGVTDAAAETVAAALGPGVEVARTERQGHAVELVRDADAGAVVVFGGDGAFNEALNGLRSGLPLGLVPGGGSSVLPRALGLPGDVEGAARRIADAIRTGRTSEVSLGRVNGRRFGFAAALGFPAEVVRRVDELGREDGRRPPHERRGDVARIETEAVREEGEHGQNGQGDQPAPPHQALRRGSGRMESAAPRVRMAPPIQIQLTNGIGANGHGISLLPGPTKAGPRTPALARLRPRTAPR